MNRTLKNMEERKQLLLTKIEECKVDIWSHPNKISNCITQACEYCGRPVGKNPLYVHIDSNGIVIPVGFKEFDIRRIGMISLGYFSIGDDCAKELFGTKINEFTTKLDVQPKHRTLFYGNL